MGNLVVTPSEQVRKYTHSETEGQGRNQQGTNDGIYVGIGEPLYQLLTFRNRIRITPCNQG